VCVRYDQRLWRAASIFLVGGIATFIVAFGALSLSYLPRDPTALAVLVSIFAVMVGLALMTPFSPKSSDTRAWYSPLRVGFSSRGVHVEYDSATARRRVHPNAARIFIAWDSVQEIWPETGMSADPHRVRFRDGSSYPPEIYSLSTELIGRIKEEIASARGNARPSPD
jgi:hypothetical protein